MSLLLYFALSSCNTVKLALYMTVLLLSIRGARSFNLLVCCFTFPGEGKEGHQKGSKCYFVLFHFLLFRGLSLLRLCFCFTFPGEQTKNVKLSGGRNILVSV